MFRVRKTEAPGTFAIIDDELLARIDAQAPATVGVDAPDLTDPDAEADASGSALAGNPSARSHLPARPRPQLPQTLVVTQPQATTTVLASLTGDEPARLITVDGRPPAVISPEDFQAPNVVLIKPPRASA